jgi:hypothetical protein
LGNLKLNDDALLIGRKSQYLCTNRIKPIPPILAFGRSLFVYSYFRFQELTSPTSGCGVRALQVSTPVPVLFTICGVFRGKGLGVVYTWSDSVKKDEYGLQESI